MATKRAAMPVVRVDELLVQAASRGDAAQREDLAAAERAGSHDGDQHYASRKQRRAAEAHERKEAKRPEFKQRKRKGR